MLIANLTHQDATTQIDLEAQDDQDYLYSVETYKRPSLPGRAILITQNVFIFLIMYHFQKFIAYVSDSGYESNTEQWRKSSRV